MTKYELIVMLIFTIIFTSSCQSNSIKSKNAIKINFDTIKVTRVNTPDSIYNDSSNENRDNWALPALGLPNLKNGFDSLQIRIAWEDLDTFGRIFVISNSNSIYSAQIIRIKFIYSKSSIWDAFIYQKVLLGPPKLGWKIFMTQLVSMGVLQLPDYHHILNYYLNADERSVSIDIGLKNIYRSVGYPDPYDRQDNIKEAKIVVNILEFIKDQFNIN